MKKTIYTILALAMTASLAGCGGGSGSSAGPDTEKGEGVMKDVFLSEEGGRFYHEQNRNVIIDITKDPSLFDTDLPKSFEKSRIVRKMKRSVEI